MVWLHQTKLSKQCNAILYALHIHTKDVYENITDHIEKIFDASNWVIERL